MTIHLRGMTWNHTRGYAPMVATSEAFATEHPEVAITWEKRSLQAFADHPLDELAARYDLVVIDHPHVGMVAEAGCLVALDQAGHDAELAALSAESLGRSHESYQWKGHQWGLAIDAAAQVSAYRPDLLDEAPTTWPQVIELARAGRVLWPIKPVDSLMCFYTLCANLGSPCATGDALCDPAVAREALAQMQALASCVPRDCLAMNPIETLDRMSAADNDRIAYCPLLYGYTNYARDGYRPRRVRFTNIPAVGDAGPRGSALGGTGIAVSARCQHAELAVRYAFTIAAADCQKSLYFDAGGQPGNAEAWDDDRCNDVTAGFFRDTRETLDRSYMRPRHDGYMTFQDRGGDRVNAFLANGGDVDQAIDDLKSLYQDSYKLGLNQ